MPRDDRRMTFIVVPHGGRDLSTRSFEVSYRRLRIVGGLLLAAAIGWVVMLISWFFLAAQAARVAGLQREIRVLEEDRQQVVQLAEALRRMEIQYEQVRRMLGADGNPDSVEVWLPPAADEQAP
jgi:Zn-dependent protease with chaperone function